MIYHGDCLDVMATFDAESIDAVVTDPPYGLGFMGKHWDHGMPGADFWREMWRVAKPGAHLLAFGGTRTYHRLACAIEDAGWEIRDCLVWAYASGFPKSHNLDGEWQGWGTALKPAWEPIVMARKPLRGTVAANVQRYGTGALNIDGTRLPVSPDVPVNGAVWTSRPSAIRPGTQGFVTSMQDGERQTSSAGTLGRWPANLVLTDPILDGDTPGVVGGGEQATHPGTYQNDSRGGWFGANPPAGTTVSSGDSGTYSRFFLVPKAARSDREPVLGNGNGRANHHPTVKPVELMRHLVRLVTPPGGTVLDPFLGSGSTALAAEMEGFAWVGVEREAEYVAIAEARLNGTQRGMAL